MMRLLFWVGSMVLVLPGHCFDLTGPKTVNAVLGSSVPVICSYNQRYQKNKKYWCRRTGASNCRDIVSTTGSELPAIGNRVSIMDNHSQNHFTITMKDLTSDDSGMYSCAVTRGKGLDLMSPVNVTVLSASQNTDHKSAFRSSSYPIFMSFLITICLKMPVFLTIVLAIIWMHSRSRQYSDEVNSETHA